MAGREPLGFGASAAVEDALWAAAGRLLPRRVLGGSALRAAVLERSRRYTSERERLDAPVGDRRRPADLAARALFFAACDAAKVRVPLFELAGRAAIPDAEPLRILDLGAGAGAMTLGALDALAATGRLESGRTAEVTAVDRDRDALAILEAAVREPPWRELAAAAIQIADVVSFAPAAQFDLVFAGTVVNELPEEARLPLVRRALAALRPGGALVILEPALRETSRDLHRLRDAAIASGAHVFAPCTRREAPCPALEDERDWCHEDRPTRLSPRARQLATATGLRGGGLKFSYLVLRNEPGDVVPAEVREAAEASSRRALRVVSQPRKLKGKLECFGCGDGGRVGLRRLGRARSESNRALDRARRGDVVVVGERDDLGTGDTVDRLEPATHRS